MTLFVKRVLAGVIKDLDPRSPWIRVNPKSSARSLYKSQTRRRHGHRGGHVSMEAGMGSHSEKPGYLQDLKLKRQGRIAP